MEIEEEIKPGSGSFFIMDKGMKVALVQFSSRDGKIMLEHTEVNPRLSGKGIGKELLEYAVNYARKNQLKVVPLCSFAREVFDKTDAYSDVK